MTKKNPFPLINYGQNNLGKYNDKKYKLILTSEKKLGKKRVFYNDFKKK